MTHLRLLCLVPLLAVSCSQAAPAPSEFEAAAARVAARTVEVHPPLTEAGQVDWILGQQADDPPAGFTYSNPGDLDRNGEVNAADLTPIGAFLGQQASSHSLARDADANGDGVVGIADVSIVGQFFGSTVREYRIYVSDSLEDLPVSATATSTIPPLAAINPCAAGRAGDTVYLSSSLHSDLHSRHVIWVRPWDGQREGVATFFDRRPRQFEPVYLVCDQLDPGLGLVRGFAPLKITACGETPAACASEYSWWLNPADWLIGQDRCLDFTFEDPGEYTLVVGMFSSPLPLPELPGRQASLTPPRWTSADSVQIVVVDPPVVTLVPETCLPVYSVRLLALVEDSGGITVSAWHWDFEGDGIFDIATSGNGGGQVTHYYGASGTYTPVVSIEFGDHYRSQFAAAASIVIAGPTLPAGEE